ncbi:MAG: hypothetical protein EOP49_08665 [Sphingobacteriales bacterium]|nr:MAG: hypothetical protein EOP49_08665 [Sphingobacteriales bacterium]
MKYIFLLFTGLAFAQVHRFVPVDNETLELVDSVEYTLYSGKKVVLSGITSKLAPTQLTMEGYDSIVLKRQDYKELGLRKENLTEFVPLVRTALALDEVAVTSARKKEIVIGEKARFVRKYSRKLLGSPDYGLLLKDSLLTGNAIKRLEFFVDGVTYKTTYKIELFSVDESRSLSAMASFRIKDLLFESPLLTIPARHEE